MVFSSEVPRQARPPGLVLARLIASATVLVLVTFVSVLNPRAMAVAVPLALVLLLSLNHRESSATSALSGPRNRVAIMAAALAAYTCIAVSWSPDPASAASHIVFQLFLGVGLYLIAAQTSQLSRKSILFITESAWVAFLIALIYLILDVISGQHIKLVVLRLLSIDVNSVVSPRFLTHDAQGHVVSISKAAFTRHATAISLFLWPLLLTMWSVLRGPVRLAAVLCLTFVAFAAAFLLPQEASKLALLVGGVTALLAAVRPKLAIIGAGLAWLLVALAPIPAVHVMYGIEMHKMTWLPYSMRDRVRIWERVRKESVTAPVFGRGPGAMLYDKERFDDAKRSAAGSTVIPSSNATAQTAPPLHAHNVFLQTWLELGAVGAVFLAGLGLSLLAAIRTLPSPTRPTMLATMMSGTVLLATTYGAWQEWYTATLAFSFVLCFYALRAFATQPVTRDR